MKVLVVACNRARFPYAVAPLGASFIVSMLRASGHEAELLDLCFAGNIKRATKRAIRRFRPDVVGLSVRNLDNCSFHHPRAYADETREIVETIRLWTDVEIIAGGSAISVGKTRLLKKIGVRYGIAGEGEHSVLALLRAIETGTGWDAIPGLIVADDSSPAVATRFDCDLSNLPMDPSACINYKPYYKTGGFVSLQTKRGCAFNCIYCNYPALEGSCYRLRPAAQCVDDMEKVIKDHGCRDFFFVDSVFNVPGKHALDICKEIIKRNLRIRWMAYCNPVGFDENMARIFRLSGCAGVELGLDAATDKTLLSMGKCFTQSDIARTCAALDSEQLPYAAFLLFGGPDETWDDVMNTRTFLDEHSNANAVFASLGIRIYEDTPIHGVAIKEGIITPETDLLQPTYYVSPHMGDNILTRLDALACETTNWITPTDWDSLLIKGIQALAGRTRSIPGWKGVSGYCKHMRRRQPSGSV